MGTDATDPNSSLWSDSVAINNRTAAVPTCETTSRPPTSTDSPFDHPVNSTRKVPLDPVDDTNIRHPHRPRPGALSRYQATPIRQTVSGVDSPGWRDDEQRFAERYELSEL